MLKKIKTIKTTIIFISFIAIMAISSLMIIFPINLNLFNIINDPQVNEILKLLRTAIVTRNDIEKLKKKGVNDAEEVFIATLGGKPHICISRWSKHGIFCNDK